jgi:hypothetical protein
MATFTTLTKKKLSWPAPEVIVGGEEVDFLFSDGTDFFFSDGTDYVFVESGGARTPTDWSNLNKS